MHCITWRGIQQTLALSILALAAAGCVRQPSAPPTVPTQLVTREAQQPTAIQPTVVVVPRTAMPLTSTQVPQAIVIESPPPNAVVGSPVVLTGRTSRYPSGGKLNYQFFD